MWVFPRLGWRGLGLRTRLLERVPVLDPGETAVYSAPAYSIVGIDRD